MINKDKFIAFLKYVGILNERYHAKLYKYYQRCYNKQYRVSRYKDYMYFLGISEEMENITDYLTKSQFRAKMDIEVSKYGNKGVWGKELNRRKEKKQETETKPEKIVKSLLCFLGEL